MAFSIVFSAGTLQLQTSSSESAPSSMTNRRARLSNVICRSSKKKISFTDQILDYIEGGPKLRKWYGAPDLRPNDGGSEENDEDDEADDGTIRDAVLVTNGDSEMGQMLILSLIVKRVRVKTLVKDKRAAMDAFGTYVESMVGDTANKVFVKRALRAVRAIICPSTDGFLSQVENFRGIQHIILLSQLAVYKGSSGIQGLINSKAKELAERDEAAVVNSGIPFTIIRSGLLQNGPGGKQGFNFKEGIAAKEKLSKEDAAFICVEALDAVPPKGLIFEVANGNEVVSDWKQHFSFLVENKEASNSTP